jgi:hypothetical protein
VNSDHNSIYCDAAVISIDYIVGTDVNTLDRCGRSPLQLALGRLRLLHHTERYSSDQLKVEVIQVRTYYIIFSVGPRPREHKVCLAAVYALSIRK